MKEFPLSAYNASGFADSLGADMGAIRFAEEFNRLLSALGITQPVQGNFVLQVTPNFTRR